MKTPDKSQNQRIQIFGPNKLQNELLRSYLHQITKLECTCCPDLKLPSEVINLITKYRRVNCTHCKNQNQHLMIDNNYETPNLILIDCHHIELSKLVNELQNQPDWYAKKCLFAFFNVQPTNNGFENEILNWNIRGVFYEDSVDPKLFSKGVLAILNGELWYPRESLSKYLTERNDRKYCMKADRTDSYEISSKRPSVLTMREREIFVEVTGGASNQEIADKHCISINTVKTHLYNVYKKINVKNRLEAMLWAAENFDRISVRCLEAEV
ncbi:LuxR C-terminal-related transcriptional regulator [Desulfococcaceae bacterium HSG7]|nr:LuxR C-terminal-related transcriptional regulator [Desulfococcaceae bacterium HSG7]